MQAAIKSICNINRVNLKNIIEKIVNESNDPARKVHHVLSALNGRVFKIAEVIELSEILGSTKYISSLLNYNNSDIFHFPNESIFIPINEGNFKTFHNAAKSIKPELLFPLREHLKINWKSLLKTPSVYAHEFEGFFKLLGIEINQLQLLRPKYPEDSAAINLIVLDSRNLFIEPEVWSKYLGEVLFQIAFEILKEDLTILETTISATINPCSLKCFPIYQLLMDTNYENFIVYAPRQILNIFKPKMAPYLIRKVVMDPEADAELTSKILHDIKAFRLDINTLKELKGFFKHALPYLHTKYSYKFVLDVWIDWEKIINEANDLKCFSRIVKYMESKEFYEIVIGFERTPKMEEFIQYYDNWADVDSENIGKNRALLNGFKAVAQNLQIK